MQGYWQMNNEGGRAFVMILGKGHGEAVAANTSGRAPNPTTREDLAAVENHFGLVLLQLDPGR